MSIFDNYIRDFKVFIKSIDGIDWWVSIDSFGNTDLLVKANKAINANQAIKLANSNKGV